MPVETIQFIASKLEHRGFDALRGSSRIFRDSLDPFEFSLHENPIASFVSKVAQGGWIALKRRLAFASMCNESIEYMHECLSLCVYKDAGLSINAIRDKFTTETWVKVVQTFLLLCATYDVAHANRISRFISLFTPDQLHATMALIWVII